MTKIQILEKRSHRKASERYIHAILTYPEEKITYDIWIPIEYRRTGLDIKEDSQIKPYIEQVYAMLRPEKRSDWIKAQEEFWATKTKSAITKSFFDVLSKEVKWFCVDCDLPRNPNWARRIQDLKEMGYTIATDINKSCPRCGKCKTHLLLLPIPRANNSGNGYENFTPSLRNKIISILHSYDAYEGKIVKKESLLPDHKFSEIRWDSDTKNNNLTDISDEEITNKFQLLTNQRNLQKREVCRNCFQTNRRGTIFGIKYFYTGSEEWDPAIPKKGKAAEKGCYGCPWYDIEKWRILLNRSLSK